ncbi:MAG: HAMP domain-containing sensor histidine kinase [Bacteroidota bacterium]
MTRKRFNIILCLMTAALTGIILLQAYWIRHDVILKNHQFDQSVKQALISVVDKVERNENMRIVAGNLLAEQDTSWVQQEWLDTTINSMVDLYLPGPPPPPQPTPEAMEEVHERMESYFRKLKRNPRDLEGVHSPYPDMDSTINIKIEKDVQQKEVIAIQMRRYHSQKDSLTFITEQRVKSKLRKLNNMMQRFTFQVIDPEENPLKRVSARELDSIIYMELAERSLPRNFNFGIKQAGTDSLLFVKDADGRKDLLETGYMANLFPNDVFNRDDLLLLYLGDKINYILISLWPMLLSSFLFSMIIILVFAYTMHTILKQKRVADIKSDFINNMTHEFKTPIATIAIANEAIKDPRIHYDNEKLEFYTTVIKDENERMLKQVENVLQMAQIDKGELTLRKEPIDMHDVVKRAIGKVMLQLEQRNGILESEFNATDFMVNGDGNHLLNAVINLIDNANKYSPENPYIKVATANVGEMLLITVKDNGIGMSKEVQRKIFETFFRAQTGNIHDVKGFGLGLSYVKAIVESHGGTISVRSEQDKGSTFTIELPTIK